MLEFEFRLLDYSNMKKKQFIKEAANVQRDIVGHGLGLKTEEIEGFDLSLPELVHSKIILVDTPGFSDTNEDRILSQLEAWLYVTFP